MAALYEVHGRADRTEEREKCRTKGCRRIVTVPREGGPALCVCGARYVWVAQSPDVRTVTLRGQD